MHPPITRRTLFALTAATAAATAGNRLSAGVLPASGRRGLPRGFHLGIQSYSLRGFPVEEALRRVVELGLHRVELFSGHFAIDPDSAHVGAMLKQVRRLDLQISAHGVNRFTANHEENRRIFDFANLAGIRNLSADPDPDSFESLGKLVEEYGIRIAIHNHGPGHRYGKIDEVTAALQGQHPRIGACADLGHFIRSGEDPVRAIRELTGRLFGIHLKDFAEQKANTRGVILGQGHLDLEAVFEALREASFPEDGALSLEYEENPDDPMADLRECLARAREAAEAALK